MAKKCKKCGKELPNNTKYKTCEACRGKMIDNIKEKGLAGGGLAAAGVILFKGGSFIYKHFIKKS